MESAGFALSGSKLRISNRIRLISFGVNGFLEHFDELLRTFGNRVFLHRLGIAESHRPAFLGMAKPIIDTFGERLSIFGRECAALIQGVSSCSRVF